MRSASTAFVESTDSALFVSDDGGATWDKRDKSNWMVWRPFYFANLIVDPKNPDRVFKTDGALILSEDGGQEFCRRSADSKARMATCTPSGSIRPTRKPSSPATTAACGIPTTAAANGGRRKPADLAVLSRQRGRHRSLPGLRRIAGQQFAGSASRSIPAASPTRSGKTCIGGDGFWMFPDPADPDYLYAEYQGGYIGRVNRHTHRGARSFSRSRTTRKSCAGTGTLRSRSRLTRKGTIYIGAQFLFRSRDHGQTWDRISPDLTTNDPEKQKQEQSGGVTVDNSAAEMHTTIYSISESPKDKNVIWVGTDDGNVQLTRDGGKTWNNVVGNVPGLPKNSWVSWVQASNFDAGTAYAAFDRHTFGDLRAVCLSARPTTARPGRRSSRRRMRRACAAMRT